MTILDTISKLKRITTEQIEKGILDIIKSNEGALVDYNIRQMLEGKRSDGKDIEPSYTPFTIEIKKSKGQPYDRVTLRDEGDFQRYMFADTKQFPVMLDSQDWKVFKLTKKYGEDIFGLTDENKKRFVEEEIKRDVQDFFKRLLSL